MVRILTTAEFSTWFGKLRDRRMRQRIRALIDRIEVAGKLVGDRKYLGDGVTELRLDTGPGIRIYLGRFGKTLVLLLLGGDKSSQDRDIIRAKRLWKEWRNTYVH